MRVKPKDKQAEKIRVGIIANKLFDDYGYDGNLNSFLVRLLKYKGVVQRQARLCVRRENWKGGPMYDYADTESINNGLSYIADRFNCAGRLLWLLTLLELPKPNET